MKKLLKKKLIQYILAFISVLYIAFVRITSKIININHNIPNEFWRQKKPFILAFWHSQLMMISFTWTNKTKINIIASKHSDGRFGAIIGKFFKLNNIPRSSKNTNASLKIIFKLIKDKECIGITPDGPRGPNQKVSDGIIKLASALGVPIICCGFWSTRNFQLKSWDKFLITLPFSKCFFIWSKAIYIQKNISQEETIKEKLFLENQLNQNIEKAKEMTKKNV